MSPQPIYQVSASSGLSTPESELESVLPIHPTAARRPYSIQVTSENTSYTDDHIIAKFHDRGADVVSLPDGQLKVTQTIKTYEFKTERKVPKTGLVSCLICQYVLLTKAIFKLTDGRNGWKQW